MEKKMKPFVGACVKFDDHGYYKVVSVTDKHYRCRWYLNDGTEIPATDTEWPHDSFLVGAEKLIVTSGMIFKAIKNEISKGIPGDQGV